MENNLKIVKTVSAIAVTLIGLLTLIFAILNLAGIKNIAASDILRFIVGIGIIVCSSGLLLLTVLKNSTLRHLSIRDLSISAVGLSFGIFLFTQGEELLDVIVGYIFPLIIAVFGGGLFLRAIINLVRKESKTINIVMLMVGGILITVGIVFSYFYEREGKLTAVTWLIIGLTGLGTGFTLLVNALKEKNIAKKNDDQVIND